MPLSAFCYQLGGRFVPRARGSRPGPQVAPWTAGKVHFVQCDMLGPQGARGVLRAMDAALGEAATRAGANPRYPLIKDLRGMLHVAWLRPILPLAELDHYEPSSSMSSSTSGGPASAR